MGKRTLRIDRSRIGIVSADLPGSLNRLAKKSISVSEIDFISPVECTVSIPSKDFHLVCSILEPRGDGIRLLKKDILHTMRNKTGRHPLFLAGICAFLIAGMMLPKFVLFIEVTGNHKISSEKILYAAESSGLSCGAARKRVRSEKIKNSILAQIPELKWVGVNTRGCAAQIMVEEKLPDVQPDKDYPGNVVAAQSGQVVSCIAKSGSLCCEPGDYVQMGQTLISGSQDVGGTILSGKAEGEIFAYTQHPISSIIPSKVMWVSANSPAHRRYRLIFPKFKIKLYISSGILGSDCGRMYKQYYIRLPGGFVLPFGLEAETVTDYRPDSGERSQEEALEEMLHVSGLAVQQDMIAGKILSQQTIVGCEENRYDLEGSFSCYEMIGRLQVQEIEEFYEYNRRENG